MFVSRSEMSTAIIVIATLVFIIALNALFVAAEFSAIRARKTRLQEMADSGNTIAKILAPIKASGKALDNYIAACQLGITASSLVLGAYGQNTVAQLLTPSLTELGNLARPIAESVSTTGVLLILTIVQVVAGELLPKAITVQRPEETALATVLPVRWAQILLKPFIWFFNGSGRLFLRLLGFKVENEHSHTHSPTEIELLMSDSHEGGLIGDKEQQMLRNTFRLRELTTRHIMVPRTQIVAASNQRSVLYVLQKAIEVGFTRIPIYQDSIDNIIGFVHVKDLFSQRLRKEENLKGILRDVIYVPETMPVFDVWQTLNKSRQYMAIVFDEYGGTAGMMTFEDLIEEIFGEVEDEFDEEIIALYYHDDNGRLHLRGDLLITDINEYLNLNLPEDELDTLGGLVFSLLGKLPKQGDTVEIDGLTICVEKVSSQRILELSFDLPGDVPPEIEEWEVFPRE